MQLTLLARTDPGIGLATVCVSKCPKATLLVTLAYEPMLRARVSTLDHTSG